jgi:hypothetical protein
MWRSLVTHLQSSRVFHRPERPFIDLKFQNSTQSMRVRTFYPILIELAYDYSKVGFASLNPDRRFAPMVPFHFECSSVGSFCVATRAPPPARISGICNRISLKTIQFAAYCERWNPTFVSSLEFANKFSASLSYNPFCIGFTYSGTNAGLEFIYNSFQEQPGFTGLFNWTLRNTEISLMTSMYGAVAALTTTKLGIAKVSSLIEANFLTLASSATHGVNVQYRDLNLTVSVSYPSNRVSLDVEFEAQPNRDLKTGFGLFLPITPKKT